MECKDLCLDISVASGQRNIPFLRRHSGDADGRLSLLEAFQTTCRELDAYYEQEKCYKSENALLEDDGDGVPSQQPWFFAQSGKDGARAARFYFRQTQVTAPPRGE
jgi:hypothetical protein